MSKILASEIECQSLSNGSENENKHHIYDEFACGIYKNLLVIHSWMVSNSSK